MRTSAGESPLPATGPTHVEHVPEDLWASWSPSLSPDGERVAFVSDRSGTPAPYVRVLAGGDAMPVPVPVPVPAPGLRVTALSWSPDGRWLALVTAPPGASRTEVWVVRPDGTGLRRVAGAAPATAVPAAGCGGWTRDGRLLLTEVDRSYAVVAVDPAGGARRLLADGELQVAMDLSADGRRLLLRHGLRTARWLSVRDLDSGEDTALLPGEGSTELGRFGPGGSVWARTTVGRDLAALAVVRLDGQHAQDAQDAEVVERPDAELEELALSDDGRTAVLTWNLLGGLSEVEVVDVERPGVGRRRLDLPREVAHTPALSADGRLLALTVEGPADPRGVWVLPTAGGPAHPVSSAGDGPLRASSGATLPGLDPGDVVAPRLLRVTSPDGTEVTGWWYAPRGTGPWPTMVHLHGGPEAQERPVYNSLFQSLVDAGVAVLAPNVRGSSGFGRAFLSADDGPRRYRVFEDVAACVDSLVEHGLAPRDRVGVMGRSYGGYLVLAMLVRRPEMFRVGIDVCGMADLETFYAQTEPWIAAAAVSKYGHPVHDRALLRDLSPLHSIDRLRAPLLVVHGADDTNVPVQEAEQVVAALARLGREHRYLLFPGEGHELLSARARVAFVRAGVDWVLQHL